MKTTTSLFKLKTVNDVLRSAQLKPVPRKLFDEFWSTGEMAILVADMGMGKSALAVQIAQSIASGDPALGRAFAASVAAQSVLYFDLEMSEKQFEMRYCADLRRSEDQTEGHFVFSDNFYRAEIDLTAAIPDKYESFGEFLSAEIADLLAQTEAKVLIFDNITSLPQTSRGSREVIEVMRELKALKDKHGLSILVLAQTHRHSPSRPISLADLQGWRVLANFADSIFAIGPSSIAHDARYLKHLKHRGRELQFDASHVPGFTLGKGGANFLGFRFIDMGSELWHLKDHSEAADLKYQRTMTVRTMAAKGKSQRTIAAELGISAATVNRYQNMFSIGGVRAYYPDLQRLTNPGDVRTRDTDKAAEKPSGFQTSCPARPLFVTKPMNDWIAEASLE